MQTALHISARHAHLPVFSIVSLQKAHQNWYSTASNEHLQCQRTAERNKCCYKKRKQSYKSMQKNASLHNTPPTRPPQKEEKL